MTLLQEIETETIRSAGQARALPFRAYSDDEVFNLELDTIFRRDWFALCAADALKESGDFLALTIAGEPIVVIRGNDGELRALSNVCRHRGTPLLDEGFGNAEKFLCPYHAWSYDHTGTLRSVPYPGDIEVVKEDHCLPRFRLEVWAGVIFVCLNAETPPLRDRLASLEPLLDHYELDRYVHCSAPGDVRHWKTNWKLAMENGMESYHLFKVHKETLERGAPTRNAYYMVGSAPWTLTAGTYTEVAKRQGNEPPGITDFELGNYVLVSLPPNLVGILTPNSWGWISILPATSEECLIVSGSLSPESPKSSGRRSAEFYDTFMEEDRVICERNQLAMKTRVGHGGQFIQLERVIVDFHQYLGSRLFGAEPDPRWVSPECPWALKAS